MKGVVILAVILAMVGAGIWWTVMRETMRESDIWVIVAIGDPQAKTIDMVVSVEMGMVLLERPKTNERDEDLWDDWVAKHFELRDADGKTLTGARIAHTMLVNEEKTINLPEFYIKYVLDKGKNYTLDYTPRLAKKKRVRYTFTAPNEPQNAQRIQFQAVSVGK